VEVPVDCSRFLAAQDDSHAGIDAALGELRAGAKRGHWIWYVFPQLAGLGSSPMARRYGLQGVEEAMAYLRDPILRARLTAAADAVVAAVRTVPARDLVTLMGSRIDAVKLVASMTLFGAVAERLNATDPSPEYVRLASMARTILAAATAQGFPACAFTRRALAH
jgi:uncharacterized protein (DUF1810 family)